MLAYGIRVYRLARELDLPTVVVLDRARRLGFGTPNQLSTLDSLQRAAVEENLRRFPPGDPPAGVTSKLRPRGPGPRTASQAKPEAAPDDEET
jgi:hypothetical protein